jgi:hypothetical protein
MHAIVTNAAATLKLASVMMDVRIDLAADQLSWLMKLDAASTRMSF